MFNIYSTCMRRSISWKYYINILSEILGENYRGQIVIPEKCLCESEQQKSNLSATA